MKLFHEYYIYKCEEVIPVAYRGTMVVVVLNNWCCWAQKNCVDFAQRSREDCADVTADVT